MGVSTPIAAEVADATDGLANEEHMPKEGILTIGLLSIIVAIGLFANITLLSGNTTNFAGVRPQEHWRVAVDVTKESAISIHCTNCTIHIHFPIRIKSHGSSCFLIIGH